MIPVRRLPVLLPLVVVVPVVQATCWDDAAQRYGVSPLELAAHACVESGLRPDAVNGTHAARTGSVDLGLMQINSSHLPRLARAGISRDQLLDDPCTNLMVGAQILAEQKQRYGDSWTATGAYNAGCSALRGEACQAARARYAWRVYRAMYRLRETGGC